MWNLETEKMWNLETEKKRSDPQGFVPSVTPDFWALIFGTPDFGTPGPKVQRKLCCTVKHCLLEVF